VKFGKPKDIAMERWTWCFYNSFSAILLGIYTASQLCLPCHQKDSQNKGKYCNTGQYIPNNSTWS